MYDIDILISARMVHASAKPFTTPFACNGPHTVQHGFGLHHINGMLALLIEVNTSLFCPYRFSALACCLPAGLLGAGCEAAVAARLGR